MRSRWVLAAAVVTLAVLTAPAMAQRQGGPGRGFGGGFRGGFGGFGGGGSLTGLLQMEEVQKELELLDDQKAEIQKIAEAERGERPDFGNFRDLSEEERNRRFAELRQQAEKREAETKEKLAVVLLPPQMERLEQLAIQRQGIRALTQDDVAAKLKLSDEQKQKIETTLEQSGERMREQLREAFQSGDREAVRAKMEEFQKQQETDVLAVLTDEQKKQFEEMKGEPFTFPEPQFGGRGGRGPGGRDGEGRRPGGEGGRQRPPSDE